MSEPFLPDGTLYECPVNRNYSTTTTVTSATREPHARRNRPSDVLGSPSVSWKVLTNNLHHSIGSRPLSVVPRTGGPRIFQEPRKTRVASELFTHPYPVCPPHPTRGVLEPRLRCASPRKVVVVHTHRVTVYSKLHPLAFQCVNSFFIGLNANFSVLPGRTRPGVSERPS